MIPPGLRGTRWIREGGARPVRSRRSWSGRSGRARAAPASSLADFASAVLVGKLGPGAALPVAEDLLAVVSPVLDEDLGDLSPRGHASGQVDPRHIRLQGLGVEEIGRAP